MIYCGCYYKVNDKILFVSKAEADDNGQVLTAYNCERDQSIERGLSVMDNEYHTVGKPFTMRPNELVDAYNLSSRCLKCKYCRHIPYAGGSAEVETLACALHEKLVPDADNEMIPDCEYGCFPVKFEPEANAPDIDFKACFAELAKRYEKRFIPSEYYTVQPEVFFELISRLKEDDLVYFGTGSSFRTGSPNGYPHETAEEYLNDPEPDSDVICFRAGNITKDVYDLLTNEKSSDKLFYALYIPSLKLACFGDDSSHGYVSGYAAYAPKETLLLLKNEGL